MNELRDYLHSISPVSHSTWKKVHPIFSSTTLRKGDLFVGQKVKASTIAFLKSGVVRAFYRSETGTEYNKHFFIPPSFIGGYASLITGKSNLIIQEALTDCEILVAKYSALTGLYNTCPDLERVARKLAEQFFVEKEQREIDIILLNADQRYLIFQEKYRQLEQLVPQYHIASYLGISPTQLSRIRKKMTGR